MRSLALLLILANISLFFWQMKLLHWLPLHPEQFAPRIIRPIPQNVQGLPSLVLLSEQHLNSTDDTKSVETNVLQTDIVVTDIAKDNHELPDFGGLINPVENAMMTDVQLIKSPVIKKLGKIPAADACFQSGPYAKISVANNAVNWLKNNNVKVNLQKKTSNKLIGTWVYLPPFESLEKAKQVQQDLDKFGIKDYHLVRGKLKNAISLGVYSVPTNAEIRVKELNSKGYNNVAVRKRYKKEGTDYWLNVKIPTNNLITSFNEKFQDFTLTSVTCESIADIVAVP